MSDTRRKPVSERLAQLMTLQPGWAGDEAGEPISSDCYHEALRLVEQIERGALVVQRVMPRTNGGINLEWDFPEAEVEVVIELDPAPDFSIYMSVYDGSTAEVGDEDLNVWEPSIDLVLNTIRKFSYF